MLFRLWLWLIAAMTLSLTAKEMQSCEQAKFYLNQCNAGRLDRDNDGIPCENVCGKKGKSEKKDDKKSDKSKSKKTSN